MTNEYCRSMRVFEAAGNRTWCSVPSIRRPMIASSGFHAIARAIAISALALVLPACAMEGDFGSPRNFSILGVPLDAAYWMSDSTHGLSQMVAPTTFSLTADEIELRKTAYHLRVQPHNLIPLKLSYSPQTSYAGSLSRQQYKYGPARMAAIDGELRADHQSLALFAAAARRVLAADQERMYALNQSREFLSRGDKINARNRMRRNFAYIEGTFADMDRRVAAYQYAIDRTRIETPVATPGAVEGSLNHLRDRSASLQYELSQLYRVTESHIHNTPEPHFGYDRRRHPFFRRPPDRVQGRAALQPAPQYDNRAAQLPSSYRNPFK